MKWFLILLGIGLTASEKLDRTYLPPPGAQYAGGNPGDILAPLEPPHFPHHGTTPIIPGQNGLKTFGHSSSTQSPVTTTSYAFTQTTTYPPIEAYDTTILPINPVTGLPIQTLGQPNYQQYNPNLPNNSQNLGQIVPEYNGNVLSGYSAQGLDGQPINIGNNYGQANNQPQNQYPSQNIQIPGSIQYPPSKQGLSQYPESSGEQSSPQHYPGKNVLVSGPIQTSQSGSQIPGANQGLIQQGEQPSLGQQGSTLTPRDQYNIDQGTPSDQGAYFGQPINVQYSGKPQFNQGSENQGQEAIQPISSSGSSTMQPDQRYSGIFSTPAPNFSSSALAHTSVGSTPRPERPQAAADRNAVIISYENVRTPNGYSYSYDTSNGIHADETGTVGDGTKAQGSYSYIGDDGKVYSVIYTADENGFQPRGDHLPTPPPIPEAIKKVIEQAARDKEAGIIDDGSYDEAKYGYKNYQGPMNRRPQTHDRNKLNNKMKSSDNGPKPITGIEDEYDENLPENRSNINIVTGGDKNTLIGGLPQGRPTNKIVYEENNNENRPISENDYNDLKNNNQGLTKEGSAGRVPSSIGNNQLASEGDNIDQQNEYDSTEPKPIGQRPVSQTVTAGAKNTNTQYPGTKIGDIQFLNSYPANGDENGSNVYNDDEDDIFSYKSGDKAIVPSGNFQDFNRKHTLEQRPKGSQRPGMSNNQYNNDKQLQSGQDINQGIIDMFGTRSDIPSNTNSGQSNINQQTTGQENVQRIDENGYYYNPPEHKFTQTRFPTRFNAQDVSPTMKPKQQDKFTKYTTTRPFITSEVYNQQNDGNRELTTRKPFMTTRVNIPKDNSYVDYEDSEDYATDYDNDDKQVSSTRTPVEKINYSTRRPYRPIQTTTRPQYTPSGQQTYATQKGTLTPGHKDYYSKTVTPGYARDSTTPTQSSRFGSTEPPRRTMSHQRRPVTSTANKSQDIPGSNKRYQTTGPVSEYPSSTAVPGYPTTDIQPVFGSRLPSRQMGSAPQTYPTTTYSPATTISSTTSGDQPTYSLPGSIPVSGYQPSTGTYETGYQNGPAMSEYSTTSRPQSPAPERSTPGYYQTIYGQNPNYLSSTTRPADRPESFSPSGPGTQSTPTETYQTGYQYGPPTPSSTSGTRPDSSSPNSSGSYISGTSPSGYVYGPSGSVYPTTSSPSTIGTTIGSLIPSTTPSRLPSYGFSTTQRPIDLSNQGTFNQNPLVDGFGRPIVSEQQLSYSYPGQEANQYPGTQYTGRGDTKIPIEQPTSPSGMPTASSRDGIRPNDGSDQSSNYPGYFDQPKIIGEDFSGPKQPQRFDPKTGYHY